MSRVEGPNVSRRSLLRAGGGVGLGLALGLGGGLAACSRGDSAGSGTPKLGWIQPTTGQLAAAFAPTYVGAKRALSEIKKAGGLLGEQVEIFELDDEGSASTQSRIAQRVRQEAPQFLLGPTGSSQAVASATALARADVIQSAWGGTDSLADASRFPFHYQMVYGTGLQAQTAARFMAGDRGLKKIGLIVEDTEFGETIRPAFQKTLKDEFKLDVVSVQTFAPDAPDLAPFVRKLADAKADGVGLFSGVPQATVLALRAMDNLDFGPIICTHDLNYHEAYDELPRTILEQFYGTVYRKLTYERGGQPGDGPTLDYAKFLHADAPASGLSSAANSPYYDFLKLIAEVVESERTLEPRAIKSALDAVQGYSGVIADYTFSESNHAGVREDSIAIGTLLSAKDEKALGGVYHELAV